jgi:hypothetical protein
MMNTTDEKWLGLHSMYWMKQTNVEREQVNSCDIYVRSQRPYKARGLINVLCVSYSSCKSTWENDPICPPTTQRRSLLPISPWVESSTRLSKNLLFISACPCLWTDAKPAVWTSKPELISSSRLNASPTAGHLESRSSSPIGDINCWDCQIWIRE